MRYFTKSFGKEREFRFERRADGLYAHCGERTLRLDVRMVGDGGAFSMIVDGRVVDVVIEQDEGAVVVQILGERVPVRVEDERERAARAVASARGAGRQEILAPMPGSVVDVTVAEGDCVAEGQTLCVLEAMKMQNPIQAEGPGVVRKAHVRVGEAVGGGALLFEIEAEGAGDDA